MSASLQVGIDSSSALPVSSLVGSSTCPESWPPERSQRSQGRSASIGARLSEHERALRAHAARLGLGAADMEDLVQETFARALRFEATFVPGSNLAAWLHRILYTVFISRCRSRQRERSFLCRLEHELHAACAPAPMPALTPRLARMLADLPGPFAEVIRLVDLERNEYGDAARTLGVPVDTVMSRLHRGRRLLRERLEALPGSSVERAA